MGIRKITVADVITMNGGTVCASCCNARATTSLDGDPLCGPCNAAIINGDED